MPYSEECLTQCKVLSGQSGSVGRRSEIEGSRWTHFSRPKQLDQDLFNSACGRATAFSKFLVPLSTPFLQPFDQRPNFRTRLSCYPPRLDFTLSSRRTQVVGFTSTFPKYSRTSRHKTNILGECSLATLPASRGTGITVVADCLDRNSLAQPDPTFYCLGSVAFAVIPR